MTEKEIAVLKTKVKELEKRNLQLLKENQLLKIKLTASIYNQR